MADKVIVFDGEPAKDTWCSTPEPMVTGMNKFLKLMDITFRRDPTNFRPRINKMESQKDQEQKHAGNYFLMDDTDDKEKKKRDKDDESDEDVKPYQKKNVAAKETKEETKEKPMKEPKEEKE